jgi:hypothetical protein
MKESPSRADNYCSACQNTHFLLHILRYGFFQQDGAPPHYSLLDRRYLDDRLGHYAASRKVAGSNPDEVDFLN